MYNRNIRPSKEWSAVLMVAAVIMCAYGAISVIPTHGMFGIIWTLVAILIVIFSGMNVFGKGFSIYRVVSVDQDEEQSVPKKSLQIVQRLYEQHQITYEEYELLRKDLIR